MINWIINKFKRGTELPITKIEIPMPKIKQHLNSLSKRPCNATDCNNWINEPELCKKCLEDSFSAEYECKWIGGKNELK